MYIKHITLQTAHIRNCEKKEVSEEALAYCDSLIEQCLLNPQAKKPIAVDGYSVTMSSTYSALVVTVWYGTQNPLPIVTFSCVTKSRNSLKIWRELHRYATLPTQTQEHNPPQTPYLAVSLHATAIDYSDAINWLGDFERCVAWAWIDYLKK